MHVRQFQIQEQADFATAPDHIDDVRAVPAKQFEPDLEDRDMWRDGLRPLKADTLAAQPETVALLCWEAKDGAAVGTGEVGVKAAFFFTAARQRKNSVSTRSCAFSVAPVPSG